MTSGHRRLDAGAIAELEPSLDGRFRDGLFSADEGHVEPRQVLPNCMRGSSPPAARSNSTATSAPTRSTAS